MPAGQRTDEAYWSGLWERQMDVQRQIDIDDQSIGNSVALAWHDFFKSSLHDVPQGARFLEIGCARSRWLPYFSREHSMVVEGLDYSEIGCEHARSVLEVAGVEGVIHHADLFDPPDNLIGSFDVVASFGVVEHFDDTASCLAACARFLKADGRLMTTIPNMRGSVGALQRILDREVYLTHNPLSCGELLAANEKAGLRVEYCHYLMLANWAVVSFDCRFGAGVQSGLRRILKAASRSVWMAERKGLSLPANQLTSPYIACLAIKSSK